MHSEGRTISGLDRAQAVWNRRKWPALLVFVTLLSATVAMARGLPNIYESTTTLLVERPQVFERPGGGSTDLDLETRLRILNQQIQSRSRLEELITQLNLYPELRQRATPEMVVERMRRDIQLHFKGVQAPMIGLDATFAFNLSYRARDPETAARVVNALAARYVEENTRAREQQTARATEFLQAQLQDADQKLKEQERRMSQFTERYNGELPEQQSANLAALGRLNEQLVVLIDRRNQLTWQLSTLAASPITTGITPSARLAKLRQQLADLRTRYTDEHPDVKHLKQEIADLERQLPPGASGDSEANGPRATIDAELAGLRNNEQAVRRAIATYEQRVENAPLREQELQQLSQDYAAAKGLYQSLLQRYQDAQLAAGMAEQRLQGEQIRILDPAVPSRLPAAPHRFRLMLMGLLLSMGAAFGIAALAETVDTSFHIVDDLRAFTPIPVLASIASVITEADVRRRRRQFGLAALAAALAIAAVVGVSSHLARSNRPPVFSLTRDACLLPGKSAPPVPLHCAEWTHTGG